MSKSTPLTQLPSQPMMPSPSSAPQQQFLNDQQKQMVTQAQQAQQTFTLPQNTQMSADVVMDDDATIQEVLNELNSTQQPIPMPPMQDPMQFQQHIPQMTMNPLQDINMLTPSSNPSKEGESASVQNEDAPVEKNDGIFHKLFTHFLKDVKLILILVLSYVLITFIPVQKFISNYFMSIERIPYSYVIVKAILTSIVSYACIKVMV